MLVSDLQLPLLQFDLSLMLSTWSVLREETRPVFRVGSDDDQSDARDTMNTYPIDWHDRPHGCHTLPDDLGIAREGEDPQREDSTFELRDGAVTEILSEEVGVLPTRRRRRATATHGAISHPPSAPLSSRDLSVAPILDGSARNSCHPRDGTIVQALLDQRQDMGYFLLGTHLISVRRVGFEPTSPCGQQGLSLPCLPGFSTAA